MGYTCDAGVVQLPPKAKKARWRIATGQKCRYGLCWRPSAQFQMRDPKLAILEPDDFSPIQRIWPPPRESRLEQPIASFDKIIRRGWIVRRIRNDAIPPFLTRASFHCPHHPQLQSATAMLPQHPNAAKISSILRTCRLNNAGKGDWQTVLKGEPPVPPIERRNGCCIEECQTMKVGKTFRDFFILSIDLSNSIHQENSFSYLLPSNDVFWMLR